MKKFDLFSMKILAVTAIVAAQAGPSFAQAAECLQSRTDHGPGNVRKSAAYYCNPDNIQSATALSNSGVTRSIILTDDSGDPIRRLVVVANGPFAAGIGLRPDQVVRNLSEAAVRFDGSRIRMSDCAPNPTLPGAAGPEVSICSYVFEGQGNHRIGQDYRQIAVMDLQGNVLEATDPARTEDGLDYGLLPGHWFE